MKVFILLLAFVSSQGFAFTLNNNFGAAFKNKKVSIRVAGSTSCLNVTTIYELEEYIKPAVDKYWNTVPTSSLRLSSGGFSEQIGNNIDMDRLCAPTDDPCIQDAAANVQDVIPPVSGIIIACNRLADNFGNGVLAVTVPNSFSGRKITGAVILINDQGGSSFSTLSRDDKIAVLAHEIGHAIGLGHTEDDSALMYYRTINQRRSLGQDDIDGVSYLYPVHVDGCGLFGGTVLLNKSKDDDDQKGPPFIQMGAALLIMITLFETLRLLARSKARATA